MHTKFQKVISFLLVCIMLTSLFPSTAFAVTAPAETGNISFALQNATVQNTADNVPISDTYIGDVGTQLSFIVLPEEGFCLESITLNGNPIPANEDGSYTVTVTKAESKVAVNCKALSEPVFSVTRETKGWSQSADYLISVADKNYKITSVTVQIGANEPVVIAPDEAGNYPFTVSENVEIKITVTDAAGKVKEKSLTEAEIDVQAPTISEPARKTNNWEKGGKWIFTVEDLGAGVESVSVTDPHGNVTMIPAEIGGGYTYSAHENGSYTITAKDILGNTETHTFTETMEDHTPAVIENIQRSVEGWVSAAQYTFGVRDNQSGVLSVRILLNGKEISVTDHQNGTYSFTANVNGVYQILATDNAGNETEANVEETYVDAVPPVIQSIVTQTEWDANKNTVSITIADDGILDTVTITNGNNESFQVSKDGNNQFSAILLENGSYHVTVLDKAGRHSEADFIIDHIDTEAPSKPVVQSTGGDQWTNTPVTVMATASDLQSGVASYWIYTDSADKSTWQEFTIEDGVGKITLTYGNTSEYYVVAQDGTGRISEPTPMQVFLDTVPPTDCHIDYLETPESGFKCVVNGIRIYSDNFSFTITASDQASGVAAIEYRVNGGEWTRVDGTEATAIVENLPDGQYTVSARAYDLAGNCSQEFFADSFVIVEKTPESMMDLSSAPEVAMNVDDSDYDGSWTNSSVSIEVFGGDAISGNEFYEYRIDYADPELADTVWETVPTENGKTVLTLTEDLNGSISFRAVSYAGNRSMNTARTVKIQKTLPEPAGIRPAAATGNNGWYTQEAKYEIDIPAVKPYQAPVQYWVTGTIDGKEFPAVQYPEKLIINTDGVWEVTVTAIDAAGNHGVSDISSAQFAVDQQVPSGDVFLDNNSILHIQENPPVWDGVNIQNLNKKPDFEIFGNSDLTIHTAAEDKTSGIDAIYYQSCVSYDDYSDDAWTLYDGSIRLNPDRKHILFFKVADKAGNMTYFTASGILLEQQAPVGDDGPEITIIPDKTNLGSGGMYHGDINFHVSVNEPVQENDTFSGLSEVTYKIYCNNTETQSGVLYPMSGNTSDIDGRITHWDGQFTLSAAKNNGNHIVIEVTATDMAGNTRTTRIQDGVIVVDLDKPIVHGKYSDNKPVAEFNGEQLFTGSRTLTVTVTERNFNSEKSHVTVLDTDTQKSVSYEWNQMVIHTLP